ncbi:hypothetical protein [uncultured Thiodictyon sp.]|uniref:hypothetical protein n=1 Tax=uncultured Thiodictyon sp. TaxID=1846217 RepID=UPI0025CCF0A7|nr:hypothetical protein [uncultured Thiodictyon sp.]
MTPAPCLHLATTADSTAARWAGAGVPDAPQRRWLIRHRDGSVASHSFSPPASRTEVQSWYPGAALESEPEHPT